MLNADILLQSRLKTVSLYLAGSVILIGTMVLLGWKFNLEFFKRPLSGLGAMNPASAVAFILSSFSFLLLTYLPLAQGSKKIVTLRRMTGYVLAFIVLLIGALKLLSLIPSLHIPIDTFLFADKLQNEIADKHDRLAPAAAVNFIFTGLALALLNYETKKNRSLSQAIALLIGFAGVFSVVGYLYQVRDFYGWPNYLPMSLHSGICFIFLSIAILFAHPDKGMMAMHTTKLSGSIVSRRFIPLLILVTIVLGYLRLLKDWMGDLSAEFDTTLLILTFFILLLLLVHYNAIQLNKQDALEKKVAERTKEISDYKDALDKSSIVGITDSRGIILYVNDNFCKISKYSREELIGQDHRIVNSGYHTNEFIKNLWTTIANGKV
jgi:PAS domain-containing protein